jgi:hypothetical protein
MLTVAGLLALPVDEALVVVADIVRSRPELRKLFTPQTVPERERLRVRMRPKRYAERVALSVRTLDRTLPPSCWAGSGKLRRVLVAEADAALAAMKPVDEKPVEDTDRPPSDVVVAARRAARGVR